MGAIECPILPYDPGDFDHGPIFANGFETGDFAAWTQ